MTGKAGEMANAELNVQGWQGPSRRHHWRYPARTRLDVTVLRSGVPDTIPGRLLNLCEDGMAAVLSGDVLPGETVGVEVSLPLDSGPLRTRALVRHQDKLRCGMELTGLSSEQRAAIRNWARKSSATFEVITNDGSVPSEIHEDNGPKTSDGPPLGNGRRRYRRFGWLILLVTAALLVSAIWWRWNRGWQELESGLLERDTAPAKTAPLQVPSDVMQKLIIHRVDPDYPTEARQAKLQGVIVVDIVVGRDGSVEVMRPMNGPSLLARSAMDALRWWKFEPYRVNGEATSVETTIAVEFRP
jgi:TonB family protein